MSCAIGAAAAGLCRPIASNQPIWPRRATITVAPGRVPLSTSRLKASDIRCSRALDSPIVSGLAWAGTGSAGRWSCRAAVCAFMVSPVALVVCDGPKSGAEGAALNRAQAASPLQSGHGLCLKRREPAARAGSLQECSSIGRAPVSKTGGRRFEPCHSCQLNQILRLVPKITSDPARSRPWGRPIREATPSDSLDSMDRRPRFHAAQADGFSFVIPGQTA